MEKKRQKRKRITKSIEDFEVVHDSGEFMMNCASKNAQKIHTYDELKVELWCDKHYHQRRTFGDKDGRREGIEIDDVQCLIVEGFKELLAIYLRGIQFSFINYFNPKKPNVGYHRIVFQNVLAISRLNVVAEIHYLDTSKFEITIITAMVVDNFNISDGQYVITLSDSGTKLRRMVKGKLTDIS